MDERRINIPEYSRIVGILVRTPAGREIRNNSQRFFPASEFEQLLQRVLNDVLPERNLDESALQEIRTLALVMKSGEKAKRYGRYVFDNAVFHGIKSILRNKYRLND